MHRLSSTVVALVGGPSGAVLAGLAGRANVRALRVDGDLPPVERAQRAWAQCRRTSLPFVVHDADPLAAVAGAWAALFDEDGAPGALEAARADVLARARAGSLGLPDYYVVLDPEGVAATLRHWYLGVLGGVAPVRVLPCPASAAAVQTALGALASGPWWPDPLERLLAGVDRVVPDQVGAAGRTPLPLDRSATPGP